MFIAVKYVTVELVVRDVEAEKVILDKRGGIGSTAASWRKIT